MNHTIELNSLMQKAYEQGNFQLEGLALQLDNILCVGEDTTNKIMDNILEFLHGLVD